ncbi:MAG TPA: ATP-binding cassette domain-containing protein [Pyrinomonadaceae bacterium]|nr:ATP-binding cassette domain-containing protein [Pyrinomonadaceae bacterium]
MAGTSVSTAAVSVSGLSITRAGRKLFDEMSWKLPPGSFLAVTGPSGAGKSSLLSCLAGELEPFGGSFDLHGRSIGCVFQDFRLSGNLSVLNNVLCGSLGRRNWWQTLLRFDAAERSDAFDLVRSLGLAELIHKPVTNVSGGEQQRTAVARTLLHRPDIILADEPTSQLDSETARLVLSRLREAARAGKTVITVLHDTRLVEDFADCELVIDSALANGWKFSGAEASNA